MKSTEKLVRDKVPERIKADGEIPDCRTVGRLEFGVALKRKLIEEAAEIEKAESRNEVVSELADLLEVVNALRSHYRIEDGELNAVQVAKRISHGAFDNRVLLTMPAAIR